MNEKKSEVGERVRYWREQRGLSRNELARRLGRHPNTLYVVEFNKGYPSVALIMDIADELDVEVGELVRGSTFYEELETQLNELRQFSEAVENSSEEKTVKSP